MKKLKSKPRKPFPITIFGDEGKVVTFGVKVPSKQLLCVYKKLHTWLGVAIIYLESKSKVHKGSK